MKFKIKTVVATDVTKAIREGESTFAAIRGTEGMRERC